MKKRLGIGLPLVSDVSSIPQGLETMGGVVINALMSIKIASYYHKEMMSYLNVIKNIKDNKYIFTMSFLNVMVYVYRGLVIELRNIGCPPSDEYLLNLNGFQALEFRESKEIKSKKDFLKIDEYRKA